jgi:hypothetical protein
VLRRADAVEVVAAAAGEAVDAVDPEEAVDVVVVEDVDGVSKCEARELKTAKDENTHMQAGLRRRTMHARDREIQGRGLRSLQEPKIDHVR